MALGSTAKKESNDNGPTGGQEKKTRFSIGKIIDNAAKLVVLVIGLPIRAAAAIVAQFVGNGGAGRAVVGGVLFLLGSAISADSVWQTVFQQRPLFPWFEAAWSWANIPLTLLNPFFYLAFLIAVGLQVIEAYALRGKNPDSARRELDDHMGYDLETKPSGKIDLVGELWKDYKAAGMKDRSTAGFISLAIWTFDLVTTFAARNPFDYTEPLTILSCIMFNVATMLAGEIGFAIWKLTND